MYSFAVFILIWNRIKLINYRLQLQYTMRALMKGKAAQFFQKKEKQVEDPEQVMNQIQAKVIARYIGIDEQQINKYQGFFQQVAKIKLPKYYTRYPSSDKSKIHYVNELTGDQDIVHPSIDIIKMAFYKLLADSNSVATFNTKTSKLLPFVEEKMIKQCIGLSSKRRDAQKANMQRDQNGKIVMSKLARIKPDMKVLLSTRSYMLKALVEKIYTRKQVWGKGKKANVYAAVLAAEKGSATNDQDENEAQETEQSLEQYEKIYAQSKKFYENKYGTLRYIPEQLKQTKSFFRSTPQSVLRNLGILNIQKTRMELYWLARLMECLPLPPGWSTRIGDSFDKFYYEPKKLLFDLHPSYIYVLEQMNSFKLAYQQMDIIHQNYYNNMKQMIFFDFFERPYNVDLYAFVEKMTQLPMTKKKAAKKSNELGKNDWMALEGIKNSELNVQHAVLIQDILQYWANLNCKQDNYIPAISPFGQITWSSTINERTINFCPHAEILKLTVQQKSLQLPRIQRDKDLKQFSSKNQQFQKKLVDLVLQQLPLERENFLQHYIRNDPKPLSRPYTVPTTFKQMQFYDSIFISPFNLQSQLSSQTTENQPLWLQKVHAKQNTDLYISLLNKNPTKFEQVKQQFARYSMEMIKKHEPSREEDIARVISEIKNNKDLKKFILHINDLDAREERKRLAAIGVVEEEQDSLGSSISQIEMEDKEEQEESSEDDIIDIEASKSDSEGQKEYSIESQQQNIVKVPTEQSKRIEEVSQQQSQPEREPQKYEGIIYNRDPTLQNISEEQLNEKLLSLRKQKLLKHKYSRSTIKDMVQRISDQLLRDQAVSKQLTDRKKNVLISRFQSEHGPYKVKPSQLLHRKARISTAMENGKDKSAEFEPFKSETSVLGNEQILPEIQQIERLNRKRREEALNEAKQQKNQDETKQTIELQPIKRIKPDINEDARLRHISQIFEMKQFSRTFKQTKSPSNQITNLKSQILKKTKKSFQDTTATTRFNPQRSISSIDSVKLQNGTKHVVSKFQPSKQQLIQADEVEQGQPNANTKIFNNRSISLQKSQSVISLSNNSISPNKLSSKFNRVCLGNTATSLLSTQPIIRVGDLIILQAKKSLISKGRGLETLVSKKY